MVRPLVLLLLLQGIAAAVSLPVAAQTAAAPAAASTELAEQARYWESRGRYDLARAAWLKLLLSSPQDADALAGVAMAEALSGRAAEAEDYLQQLRAVDGEHPRIAAVEDALRSASYDRTALEAARSLAREGRYDEAVEAYERIFSGNVPAGRLGLEYYQTLAGTQDGWEPARAGIERLVREYPDQPIYRLALAQHLTYRESTRRRGIEQLRALAGVPETSDLARQAWRQALLWLGARPGDEGLYRAYLSAYGQDAEVAAKLDTLVTSVAKASEPQPLTPQQILGERVREAFGLLDNGHLGEAATAFEAILDDAPRDSSALGGLGITRLRQRRYAQAQDLLQKASAAAPSSAARWREALSAARFWNRVSQAQSARDAGRTAEAEALLREAINGDPAVARDEPSVLVTLGDVLVEQLEYTEAEQIFRQVLAKYPDNADAARGLVGLLASTGRLNEALALLERLPAEQRAEVGGLGPLKGQALREQAEAALAAGDAGKAEALLKQALLQDPESPWTRLDLARLYLQQKRYREANTLVDGLLTGGRSMPDALYVKAMLLADQQSWYEALATLERIPPGSRTPAMAELQQRLWVRYQAERAGVYARYGRVQEASAILDGLAPYATSNELLGALAAGYADAGEEQRALNYMRQALTRTAEPDVGLRMQYAALLFRLRQDAEFEVVMQDLLKRQDLTPQQSLDLAGLRIGYQLRQADLLREEGNLARAYEYLQPLLQANPNDPRVLLALGRLYGDAGDFDQALALNQRVLQIDAENLDAYKGAIGAALALNELELAERYLETALQLQPDSARLHAFAARIARSRGEDGRALALYQQALLLDQQPGGGEFGGQGYQPELRLIDPAASSVYAPAAATAPAAAPMTMVYPESVAASAQPVRPASAPPRPVPDSTSPVYARPAVPSAPSGVESWVSAPVYPPSPSSAPRAPLLPPVQLPPVRLPDSSALSPAEQADPTIADPARLGLQAQTGSALVPPPAPPPYQAPQQPAPTIYPYQPLPSYSPPPAAARSGLQLRSDTRLGTNAAAPQRRAPQSASSEILGEIAAIRAERAASAGMGFAFRSRDGEDGLDKLYDMETPIELSMAGLDAGRFKLRVVPVHLDAGTVDGQNLARFGTLPLVDDPALALDQDATGAAVAAVYEQGSFHADFGASPLGFDIETLVGGIRWRPSFDRLSFRIDLARRSVTDSLLSYAGAYDPGTATHWGAVTRNGGRIDASYDFGGLGIYGNLGYHLLDGENVEQNNLAEVGAGLYARAYETATARVTYGLNFTSFFYEENLRRFTYGHGGYFSPQSYFAFAVPVEWSGANARLAYRVGAALGVQTFEEDAVAVFPNDSELQAALEAYAADHPADAIETYYPSQNSTGLGLNFSAAVEYLAAPNVALGGQLGFDNARDYNEASVLGYVRYLFYPQRRVTPPPSPIAPYYRYGNPTQ